MTPMMILVFHVQPLAAVSSDLVASMVMKPVGGAVHLRKGTVNQELVKWLVIGSVPAAFCGVLLLRAIGHTEPTQTVVKTSLGVALLFAAAAMVAKALLDLRKRQKAKLAQAAGVAPVQPASVRDPADPDAAHRHHRRPGRRHDLGRLGLADDRLAAAALSDAAGQPAGRHRPGAGRAAGRLGVPGAHPVRRLPVRPDGIAADRGACRASTSAPGSPAARLAASCGAPSLSCCSPRR